jgi:hypothetical protein
MAGIIYNSGNVSLNPTDGHLPVRIGNQFLDSSFFQEGDFQNASYVNTVDNNGSAFGFKMEPAILKTSLGDFDGLGNSTRLILDDNSGTANLFAYRGITIVTTDPLALISMVSTNLVLSVNTIRINGTVNSPSAGASSGQFLMININGTAYKINLLLP